jgi:nuclear GTP-binding protein
VNDYTPKLPCLLIVLHLQSEAEKQRLKEERKAAGNNTAAPEAIEEDGPFDGISALGNAPRKTPKKAPAPALEVAEVDEVPLLRDPDLPTLRSALLKADVVIQVLDARNPLPYRSAIIEKIVKEGNRKVLHLLNKIGMSALPAFWSQ